MGTERCIAGLALLGPSQFEIAKDGRWSTALARFGALARTAGETNVVACGIKYRSTGHGSPPVVVRVWWWGRALSRFGGRGGRAESVEQRADLALVLYGPAVLGA